MKIGLSIIVFCIAGCAGFPAEIDDRWRPALADEAIVAVMEPKKIDTPGFCLRVFGEPPSRKLTRQLRTAGHRLIHCREATGEYRIHDIRETPSGDVILVAEESAGFTSWGERLILRRDDSGTLRIVDRVGLWES